MNFFLLGEILQDAQIEIILNLSNDFQRLLKPYRLIRFDFYVIFIMSFLLFRIPRYYQTQSVGSFLF
jgi:hypothetical protein